MKQSNLFVQRKILEHQKNIIKSTLLIKKLLITLLASCGLAAAVAMPAFAAAPKNTNLLNDQWRAYSINTNLAKLWSISNAKRDNGVVALSFSNYSTNWFAVYLNTNYNVDLTGKTVSVAAKWTPSIFTNRESTPNDATFRIYFASAQGNYNSYSYWWTTGSNSVNLNNLTGTGSYSVNLSNPAQWSDLCGGQASDTTVIPTHSNCVGSTDPTMSPYQGFVNAMKNVKLIGISFGGGDFYANGVANTKNSPANFDLTEFNVTK